MKLNKILATTALLSLILPGGSALGSEADFARLSMLTEIAGEYTAVGQKDKAVDLLAQALPLVQTISDECDKPEPIAEIARQYAAAGQEARSSQLIAQAIQVAKTATGCLGHNDEFENLGDIANRYWEDGQYDQALQILRQIDDDKTTGLILAYYATQLVEVGRNDQAAEILAEAIQSAQAIDDANFKAVALFIMVDRTMRLGQKAQAVEVLDQALQAAQSIEDVRSKLGILSEIAGKYTEVGQKTQSLEVLSQALSIAQTIDNDAERHMALS